MEIPILLCDVNSRIKLSTSIMISINYEHEILIRTCDMLMLPGVENKNRIKKKSRALKWWYIYFSAKVIKYVVLVWDYSRILITFTLWIFLIIFFPTYTHKTHNFFLLFFNILEKTPTNIFIINLLNPFSNLNERWTDMWNKNVFYYADVEIKQQKLLLIRIWI